MKKKLFVGALVGLATLPMTVNAAGVGTVKFEGESSVNVGDEFKVNMVIDNVKDTDGGVVAFGGYISFDNNVLQLVSAEKGNAYDVILNEDINMIAAIDYTLANGIYDRTNVYTMTFKAIGEGNTAVTLRKGELVDRTSDLDFTVESLDVNAKNVVVEKEVVTNNTIINNNIEEKTVEKYETTENIEKETVVNKEEKKAKKTVKNTKKKTKKAKKVTKKNSFVEFFTNIFNKIFMI